MEAYLAHLGRARGVRFSSEYLNVLRLRDFGILGSPCVEGNAEAADYEVWRLNGLVPHAAFAYTGKFVKELNQNVKVFGLKGFVRDPTLLLAERVKVIDAELVRADHGRAGELRGERVDLFERALEGLDPKVDPIQYTRNHINFAPFREILINHVQAPVDGGDHALDVIRAEIGHGRNVMLYYTSGDLMTGFGPTLRERFGRKRQPVNVNRPVNEPIVVGHAVVVEGYDLDPTGHISSLWLRDSNGPRRGDQGHLRMPIDIFRRYALGIVMVVD